MIRGRFLRLMGIFLVLSLIFFLAGVSAGPAQEGSDGTVSGVMFLCATGAAIVVNDTGIYLSNGKGATITLVGPTVAVNVAALVVT